MTSGPFDKAVGSRRGRGEPEERGLMVNGGHYYIRRFG